MGEWDAYYAKVGNQPNGLVVSTVEKHEIPRRKALDLGAGNLRDSKYLLSAGFERITAVDIEPPPQKAEGVESVVMPLEAYVPPLATFDLVVCCNTLFFFSEAQAVRILTRAYNALTEEGLMVGNLLGEKDEWVTKGKHGVVGHTKERLDAMLSSFANTAVKRETGERPTALGVPKFWDTWKILVSK